MEDQSAAHGAPGNGQGEQPGNACVLPPCVTLPPTAPSTELDNGTLVLQGRSDGPRVRLDSLDTGPLKRKLATVFELTEVAIDHLEPDVTDDDEGDAQ